MAALEETAAEPRLGVAELMAEGRGGQVQLEARGGEAAGVGDRGDELEVADFETGGHDAPHMNRIHPNIEIISLFII